MRVANAPVLESERWLSKSVDWQRAEDEWRDGPLKKAQAARRRAPHALQHDQRPRDRAAVHAARLDGRDAGGGGPTAVDHLGDRLRQGDGPWSDFDPMRDVGYPGEPPFTRGIHPTGYRTRLWTMRMFAGFGVCRGHQRALPPAAARPGQTGLSIAYDMPTLYGYDTDDPEAEGEFGTCGVAVSLAGGHGGAARRACRWTASRTSMTINSPAAPIWAMYIAAAEKRGFPRAQLEGTTQNDILKEFVAQKEFLFPPEPSMRLVTDTIEFGTRELPKWNTISISGYHIREAGSTAVQELAFTIADGMAYVEEAIKRGLRVDEFAPRLSFFFNSHNDFFEEIAKFRAARRDLVEADDAALPGGERALDLDALPHPDRRRVAHRAAAAEQPDARRHPGAGGGARRHAVAAHRRVRRGVGRAVRRGRAAGPAAAAGHRRPRRA